MRSVRARHSLSYEKFNNGYENDLRLIRDAKNKPKTEGTKHKKQMIHKNKENIHAAVQTALRHKETATSL